MRDVKSIFSLTLDWFVLFPLKIEYKKTYFVLCFKRTRYW